MARTIAALLGSTRIPGSRFPALTAKHPDRPPAVVYDSHETIRHMPLMPHEMTAAVKSTDKLFTLAHLGLVRLTAENWRLDVTGLVERPLRLRLPDLRRFRRAWVEAGHQCAGSPLAPTVATRRIAYVVWEGVWLRDVLAEAGIRQEATYVWSGGADAGRFEGEAVPFFRKDLPLTRLDDNVLLATAVNGDKLPDCHVTVARSAWSCRASTAPIQSSGSGA